MSFFGLFKEKSKEPLWAKTDIEVGERVILLGGECLVDEVCICNKKHEGSKLVSDSIVLIYKNNNGEYKRVVIDPELFYSIRLI